MRHALLAAGARHDVSKLFPPLSVAIEFHYDVPFESRERVRVFVFSTGMFIK
jgi:hypothetical protein